MRTGFYDHTGKVPDSEEGKIAKANECKDKDLKAIESYEAEKALLA